LAEVDKVNLENDLERIAKSIANSNISSKTQDFIVEVCCALHQIYSNFNQLLIAAIMRQYREPSNSIDNQHREFNKKRYFLRLLTELYLKGLFQQYKEMFPCLNELILITQDHPSFLNAIMVITDYFKTYGEQIFQIISRERRIAIDCHYEVKISPT
jgi:hypothetical protein